MKPLLIALFGFFMGFSTESALAKTLVLEGTPQKPHRKIMIVEVSDASSNPTAAKNKLEKKLIRKADKYDADAISDIKYFPAPNEPSYLRGKRRFARGTLVEYVKYPQAEAAVK